MPLSLPYKNLVQLVFGVVIGLLVGICFNFENENEEDSLHRISPLHSIPDSLTNGLRNTKIWLRCIVLIQPSTENPHKYVAAIKDTYSRQCNNTMFFTNSEKLQTKLAESVQIFLIDSPTFEPSEWKWLHVALKFAQGKGSDGEATASAKSHSRWVAVLNEQNYLVVRNLLELIRPYSHSIPPPIIIGETIQLKSVFSYLFPFLHLDTFRMDGGLVVSERALDMIVDVGSGCSPDSWFIPKYAGKSLLKCSRELGIPEWEPVDEATGQPLFITTELRSLFSNKSAIQIRHSTAPNSSDSSKVDRRIATTKCCSHRVICFGSMPYRDQRLIHFFADSTFSVYGR